MNKKTIITILFALRLAKFNALRCKISAGLRL